MRCLPQYSLPKIWKLGKLCLLKWVFITVKVFQALTNSLSFSLDLKEGTHKRNNWSHTAEVHDQRKGSNYISHFDIEYEQICPCHNFKSESLCNLIKNWEKQSWDCLQMLYWNFYPTKPSNTLLSNICLWISTRGGDYVFQQQTSIYHL